MLRTLTSRILVALVSIQLAALGYVPAAQAAIIGTGEAIAAQQRAARIDHVRAMLSRDDVSRQMSAMGVDPARASERVAALTDSELQAVEGQLESLPAGAGVVWIVGAVFIVLIILELVGVTHIFSAF